MSVGGGSSNITARTGGGAHLRILNVCRNYESGVSADIIQRETGLASNEIVKALNELIAMGRISAYKEGHDAVYRAVPEDMVAKLKGLSMDEVTIYHLIEQSKNTGIWSKDLKDKSHLQPPTIAKILKILESRQLIKSVKTIAGKNKKVYMLYHLEPSRDIQGGPWYSGTDFDVEFINVLHHTALEFIKTKRYATTPQIAEYIRSSGFSTVELRPDDLQNIVDMLVYDGLVEETSGFSDSGHPVYVPVHTTAMPHNTWTDIPCGVCPVFDQCHEGGEISPQTCVYFKKWLEL